MIDRKPGCLGFDLLEDERALKKTENSGGYWDTTRVEKMECSASSRELCYTLGEMFSTSALMAMKGQGIKMRGHEVIHIIHSFSLPPGPEKTHTPQPPGNGPQTVEAWTGTTLTIRLRMNGNMVPRVLLAQSHLDRLLLSISTALAGHPPTWGTGPTTAPHSASH